MKVSIIGQGYVGLTLAITAAKSGYEVVGFDINNELVENLKAHKSHVEGVSATDLKQTNYQPTSDPSSINGSDVVVIAVPTPLDENRKPDLLFLDAACRIIGENLKNKALIINESTSFPGTLRDLISKQIEEISGLNHLYAASPERVDPGNPVWNQTNTPRLVAGLTQEATNNAIDFYSKFCSNVVPVSSPEVAEAAKLFENTFRFINIGLVNEFAQVMGAMGIPVDEVLSAAATKPYGFMPFHPNVGIGGHCIPVDPMYLQQKAKEIGIESKYIAVSEAINHEMPKFIVSRLRTELGGLRGKKIQVVGVSYKANVADTRETPAVDVVKLLESEGAQVTWHDPLVSSWNGSNSSPLNSSVDAGLVLVAHDEFEPSGWGSVPVYSINRHPRFSWTPLITVKSKY